MTNDELAALMELPLEELRRRARAPFRLVRDIPALLDDCSGQRQLERALVENLQREDLNAMEEARAYQELIGAYGLSQEEAAQRVGKARAAPSFARSQKANP